MRLHVARTDELDPRELDAVHHLLVDVFGRSRGREPDDFTDDDWQHSLGGVHVIAFDDDDPDAPIGHAAVVDRSMVTGGRTLRVGYVEGVGVRASRQRLGIGGQMMGVLEAVIEREFDLGALSASDAAIRMYTRRGWVPWRGPLSAATPVGVVATPDEEGGVFVWDRRIPAIDVTLELTCDWRAGDLW